MDTSAEKIAQEEERRPRKVRNMSSSCIFPALLIVAFQTGGKSQVERVTAAAHMRHQAVFNPGAQEAVAQRKKNLAAAKMKRKVSLGVAVDAETGKPMPIEEELEGGRKEAEQSQRSRRQSKRKFTVESRTAHIERMRREEEERKVSLHFLVECYNSS